MKKHHQAAWVLGTALTAATLMPAAQAADSSPFSSTALASGYQLAQADSKAKEGKCGEAKCGADKKKEGKCGEAKCGADKKSADKKKDGKCGEGKCGAKK